MERAAEPVSPSDRVTVWQVATRCRPNSHRGIERVPLALVVRPGGRLVAPGRDYQRVSSGSSRKGAKSGWSVGEGARTLLAGETNL